MSVALPTTHESYLIVRPCRLILIIVRGTRLYAIYTLMHTLVRQVLSLAAGQFFIEYYEQLPDRDPLTYAVRITTL